MKQLTGLLQLGHEALLEGTDDVLLVREGDEVAARLVEMAAGASSRRATRVIRVLGPRTCSPSSPD